MIERLSRALDRGAVVITVKPGKRETRLVSDDPFVIELAARPIEGAANRELLTFLKATVGACRIASGQTSRTKRIERLDQ